MIRGEWACLRWLDVHLQRDPNRVWLWCRVWGVHGTDEWVDLASVRAITEVYAHTLLSFCGDAHDL